MTTTVNPTKTRSTSPNGRARDTRPRVRGSARSGRAAREARDTHYDLLTAALVGLAVGAGTTLLLRRGPDGNRPIVPAWRAARASARLAGRGARYAWDRGVDAWERLPREEIEDRMREYLESARDTFDDMVQSEFKDLRRAIRRQRKKFGI